MIRQITSWTWQAGADKGGYQRDSPISVINGGREALVFRGQVCGDSNTLQEAVTLMAVLSIVIGL